MANVSNAEIAAEFDDLMGGFGETPSEDKVDENDQVVNGSITDDVNHTSNGHVEQSMYDDESHLHTNGVHDNEEESFGKQVSVIDRLLNGD